MEIINNGVIETINVYVRKIVIHIKNNVDSVLLIQSLQMMVNHVLATKKTKYMIQKQTHVGTDAQTIRYGWIDANANKSIHGGIKDVDYVQLTP